jgi:hypothetical protein
VDDEVLAGAAALISVAGGGERERALEQDVVDPLRRLGGVLADHSEQIPEQGSLCRRQTLRDGILRRRGDRSRADPDLRVPAPVRPGAVRAGSHRALYVGTL